MKLRNLLALICIILSIIGCKKQNSIIDNMTPSPLAGKENTSTQLAAVGVCSPFTPPSGWAVVKTATYAKLMRPTTGNINVIVANIKNNNATVIPLYDPPTPNFASTTTPSPLFPKGDIWFWWNKDITAFGVANCSYFDRAWPHTTTELTHALQQSWSLRSTGKLYGQSSYQRWICFNNGYATIGDGPNVPITTNYYTSASAYYGGIGSTVLGGLHPVNASAQPATAQGRTMVGIKDCDGDGLKEIVYILTADNLTQSAAYDILRLTFQCDQTIMFDGGGSTQMICKGVEYVTSSDNTNPLYYQRRKVPVTLRVRSN